MGQSETERVYEELLVTLVRGGDRRAGELLAARWQPRLLRSAKRLLGNDEQARDAVQEAWIGIYRGWFKLSDPAKFPVWAYSILHRKCADRIKVEIRHRSHHVPAEAAHKASIGARGEGASSINLAFERLSPPHRVAAVLFFSEGLSLAEIAAVTGVPIGTAKSRIFHARQHLKAALSGEEV